MEAGTLAPPAGAAQDTIDPDSNGRAPVEDLQIDGTGQLSMSVGGKRVTSSEVRLQGGAIKLEGQFEKGERIALEVVVVVGEVHFVDKHDAATGQVVECIRRHKARVSSVSRVAD